MKTKSFFIAILALFMLMTACAPTSPSPTVELTPTPTETPAPTPDPALLASPTQEEVDYLKEVFKQSKYRPIKNDAPSPYFYQPDIGIDYKDYVEKATDAEDDTGNWYEEYIEIWPTTVVNIDAAKLDTDLLARTIASENSTNNGVYGGLFYDPALLPDYDYNSYKHSDCRYGYNLLLYFDCKVDNACPLYMDIYSIENGVMKIVVFCTVGDNLPDNMLVNAHLVSNSDSNRSDYAEVVNALNSITEVEVDYITVTPPDSAS